MKYLVLFLLMACGQDFNYGNFSRDESHYTPITNTTNLTSNKKPDLTPGKNNPIYLENRDFGIQVALYQNKKFYYRLFDLGKTGDGFGNWSFRSGEFIIDTNGKRSLFDVVLHIFSADPEAKTYKVRFRDRFGWQVLKLNIVNKNNSLRN